VLKTAAGAIAPCLVVTCEALVVAAAGGLAATTVVVLEAFPLGIGIEAARGAATLAAVVRELGLTFSFSPLTVTPELRKRPPPAAPPDGAVVEEVAAVARVAVVLRVVVDCC